MREHSIIGDVHRHSDGWSTRYSHASEDLRSNDWVSARWVSSTGGGSYVMELAYRPGYWVALHWASDRLELHGPFMDLHVAKTSLILLTGDGP